MTTDVGMCTVDVKAVGMRFAAAGVEFTVAGDTAGDVVFAAISVFSSSGISTSSASVSAC